MRSIIRYILIAFVILLIISGVAALFQGSLQQKEKVSLTQIAQEMRDGKVKEIVVSGDQTVEITLTDDTEQSTQKEIGVSLIETMKNLGVSNEILAKTAITIRGESGLSLFLLNVLPFLIPAILIFGIFWFMMRGAQRGSMQALNFGKSRARLSQTTAEGKKVTFKDVAGLDEVKEEIQEVVEFLKTPERFHKIGARIPRGILLVGLPGTGKTLLAKAVANEAQVPFFSVSGSEFVELFVGVGANRVRDTFDMAKKSGPSLLFIDELDAIGRHRGAGLGGGHDEREQTLNQILVEMDGFNTNDKVVVIASTNRPDILDPALLRPGRFDRKITLYLPDIKDRSAILKIHAQGKPFAKSVNLEKVAQRTAGFSGADLANLVNEAAILAVRNKKSIIGQDHFFQAIEKVMLGPERKSRVFSEQEKKITAYHEAGHALVAVSLPHTDPIHKITIISRGMAGGYTLKLPTEDKHLKSREEFRDELAVLMGGYSAEKEIFDDITTGASNDLHKASEIARNMVTRYGMSDALGPVTFGDPEHAVFLGKDITAEKNYSEKIAFQIDEEIKRLLEHAKKKAQSILKEKLELLHKIANELLEKETLEQEEFYTLLKA